MGTGDSVTELLHEWRTGDPEAFGKLVSQVYSELRRLADGCLRSERADHTLQPTALVHEAYLRLSGGNPPDCRDRCHFLSVAARVMRQILVDHARRHQTSKRGRGEIRFVLDESIDAPLEKCDLMVRLDDALTELERGHPRKARLIEMRFFGGLTADESAEVMGLDVPTVRRELRFAQAWLQRELDQPVGFPAIH